MPRVIRRLNLTASALHHGGNAAYLSEVDRVCPPSLSGRLAEPPAPRRPWRGLPAVGGLATLLASLAVGWNLAAGVACGLIIAVAWTWLTALAERRGTEGHAPVRGRVTATVVGAMLGIAAGAGAGAVLKPGPALAAAGIIAAAVIAGAASIWSWRARVSAWRHELPLDEAAHAADALADLVAAAAGREWSGRNTMLDEVIRARIALDGISSQLTEHAEAVSESGSQAQASRAARLSESLMAGLRDLVRTVLTAGSVTASAGGRAAFEQARAKTATLIKEWTQHALEQGVLAPVPFAAHAPFAAAAPNDTQYADETEIAEIIEAVRYDPREVMWQLCAPSDLNVLDVVDLPQLIAFAPRLYRQQLSDVLPAEHGMDVLRHPRRPAPPRPAARRDRVRELDGRRRSPGAAMTSDPPGAGPGLPADAEELTFRTPQGDTVRSKVIPGPDESMAPATSPRERSSWRTGLSLPAPGSRISPETRLRPDRQRDTRRASPAQDDGDRRLSVRGQPPARVRGHVR